MKQIVCPGCGEKTSIDGLKIGDRIECPNCANLTLRVKKRGEELYLEEVPKVSCPSCNCILEVPENTTAGDTIQCCGKEFHLTYEFGTYALKETLHEAKKGAV